MALYSVIVQYHNVQIALPGDFAQVRIKSQIGFTDAVSFIYHIQTHDLCQDIADNLDAYDKSDYPIYHPFHSKTTANVLGKIRNEFSSLAPPEFVGLRAKMYSILLPNDKPKFTAKGVSLRYILKHIHHKEYIRTLKGIESTITTFNTLRSLKQQMEALQVTKKCLSSFHDKRYILTDEVPTTAYGRYKIARMKST